MAGAMGAGARGWRRLRSPHTFFTIAAAATVAAVLAAYAWLIADREVALGSRSGFVVGVLVATTAATLAGLRPRASVLPTASLGFAATLSLALGFLAIFSIGLPLLGAGLVIATMAAERLEPANVLPAAIATAFALAVLVLGILLTA